MTPVLKISNLTNLQDARYSAALGFDLISFSLERGSNKKLPLSSIWSMVQWLEGPGVVLELNDASIDELEEISFMPRYFSFPLPDWDEDLWEHGSAMLLRCDSSADPVLLNQISVDAERLGKEMKFEITVRNPDDLGHFEHLFPHVLLNFTSLEQVKAYIHADGEKAYGISFREEAEEEPNVLDYEALDDLMAVYSDVHL